MSLGDNGPDPSSTCISFDLIHLVKIKKGTLGQNQEGEGYERIWEGEGEQVQGFDSNRPKNPRDEEPENENKPKKKTQANLKKRRYFLTEYMPPGRWEN